MEDNSNNDKPHIYKHSKFYKIKLYINDRDVHEARLDDILRRDIEKALMEGRDAVSILKDLGLDVDMKLMNDIEDFINRIITEIKDGWL